MKRLFLHVCSCLGFLLLFIALVAQEQEHLPQHIQMALEQRQGFYEVKQAFHLYHEQKHKGKGSGWKQFQRWVHWMEPRVYPSGEWPEPDIIQKEIHQFWRARTVSHTRSSLWKELGPRTWEDISGSWTPGIGRINVIISAPSNPQILYVGAPSGGLWRSMDDGNSWTPLTDHLPGIGVSGIAIDPADPQTIFIGTGDKDHVSSTGQGVWKSVDFGATWDPINTGLPNGVVVKKLLIHPVQGNILWAATSSGIFLTQNAGAHWQLILPGNADDLELNPQEPSRIYAVLDQAIWVSEDGGESFDFQGHHSAYRMQIAVSQAAPDVVYAFSQEGIFRSNDSGLSFTYQGPSPTQGIQDWYDLAIAVSHEDADEVHVGEIETFRSRDGGKTFSPTSRWMYGSVKGYVHADIHEMVFVGGRLYVGSDGLISVSEDGGNTWLDLTRELGIRQISHVGVSLSHPDTYLIGCQDNGTSVYAPGRGWHEWLGGDGFACGFDPFNPRVVYGSTQMGRVYKSIDGGNHTSNIFQPGIGGWETPMAIDPNQGGKVYVGLEELCRSSDAMQTWDTLSIPGVGVIHEIAVAHSDSKRLFFSKQQRLWRSLDGGEQWEEVSHGLPNRFITSIAIHPHNPQQIAISFSGYSEGEKVYLSEDGGISWSNVSGNLPNLPANTLAFHPEAGKGLFVGMDVGIYQWSPGQGEWRAFMEGLPLNAPITDLNIHPTTGQFRAATFGRGLWETNLLFNGTGTVTHQDAPLAPAMPILKVFPNPTQNQISVNYVSLTGDPMSIHLLNLNGSIVKSWKPQVLTGENTWSFSLGGLSPGPYILELTGPKGRIPIRLTVIK